MRRSLRFPRDAQFSSDARGQWASGGEASYEHGRPNYSAAQATGAPNVTTYADHPETWVSASAERGEEWLKTDVRQSSARFRGARASDFGSRHDREDRGIRRGRTLNRRLVGARSRRLRQESNFVVRRDVSTDRFSGAGDQAHARYVVSVGLELDRCCPARRRSLTLGEAVEG